MIPIAKNAVIRILIVNKVIQVGAEAAHQLENDLVCPHILRTDPIFPPHYRDARQRRASPNRLKYETLAVTAGQAANRQHGRGMGSSSGRRVCADESGAAQSVPADGVSQRAAHRYELSRFRGGLGGTGRAVARCAADLPVSAVVERDIVEDIAVLVNLNKGGAAVSRRAQKHLLQVLGVLVYRAGDE